MFDECPRHLQEALVFDTAHMAGPRAVITLREVRQRLEEVKVKRRLLLWAAAGAGFASRRMDTARWRLPKGTTSETGLCRRRPLHRTPS